MKKLIALLLCLSMAFTTAAMAETAAVEAAPEATAAPTVTLNDGDVLVTLNGQDLTWADIKPVYDSLLSQYSSYYDMSDPANVELFEAVAMENKISETMLSQKAEEYKLTLTDEEAAAAETSAQSDWDNALASYISQSFPDLTEESAQEDKDKANAEAVKYFNDLGYSPESLKENYKKYAVYDKVEAMMTQDATVTDEEVEKMYQDLVAADKELYQNDINAYVDYNNSVDQMAMYAMYYGSANNMDYAWYRPAGFRAVKHILLPVDEALMTKYQDLQARLEEQMNAETTEAAAEPAADAAAETTEPAAEPTATPEPVTQADVDNAKAEILASLADTIDEINQKVAEGADFDELIATYAVKADGTPTDAGMTNEPGKTSGYEVCAASTNYVAPFVEAAFSVNTVGEVSAPYISDYGVHIVKYVSDIPEGPIAMTDAQREAKRDALLSSKQNELYTATMNQWLEEATITYSGLVPSMADIQAREAEAAATEEAVTAVPEDTAAAEETVAPEATAAGN